MLISVPPTSPFDQTLSTISSWLCPPAHQLFFGSDDPADPRMGQVVQRNRTNSLKMLEAGPWDVVIVGVNDDSGITRNRGRAGAAAGPDSIRRRFYTMTPGYRGSAQSLAILDLGNLEPAPNADTGLTHDRVTGIVAQITARGAIPILLGGGHDHTFAGVRGLYTGWSRGPSPLPDTQTTAPTAPGVGVIYLDAHLDMRDLGRGITSGTPFFRLLEGNGAMADGRKMTAIGIQRERNALAHLNYAREKMVHVVSLEQINRDGMEKVFTKALARASHSSGPVAFSIDIDCVSSAYAPGASASYPAGLTPDQLITGATMGGRHPSVQYLDLMELCPRLDQDDRTANLAASALSGFLRGLALR